MNFNKPKYMINNCASRFKNEVLFKANPRPVAMYCAPPYCMSSWKARLLVCCREMKKAREPAIVCHTRKDN